MKKKFTSFLFLSILLGIMLVPQKTFAACSGTSTETSQADALVLGYNYQFSTAGTDVTVEFELLDTKVGLVAFAWTYNPDFAEVQMANTGGNTFSYTFTGQTFGAIFTIQCKFAYAGGMSVTKTFAYTVGDNCAATGVLNILGSNNGAAVCEGNDVILSAPNSLTGTDYTWYKKAAGENDFSVIGTTTDSTYVVNPTVATEYYVQFGGENSDTLSVTTKYCYPITLTGSNNEATICAGTNVTLTATTSLIGNEYTWYKKGTGEADFSVLGTSTVATYDVTPDANTEYYVQFAEESSDTLSVNAISCQGTACEGTSMEASQGSFPAGYNYEFTTVGTTVNVTFEILESKTGLVAYAHTYNPNFAEVQMTNVSGNVFSSSFTGQTIGATFSVACKFAYAGGDAITKVFEYTVGDACDGSGITNNELKNIIYPNPAAEYVNIVTENNSNISIYDLLGKIIYTGTVQAGTNSIYVGNYANGSYIIKLGSENFLLEKK